MIAPPGGFTRGLGRNQAPLQLLVDATNVIQGQSVENYLKTIVGQVVQEDLKITAEESPIQFDLRVLYNPSLETAIFMVPGVMCTLMVMTTMMLSMAAIVREKEMRNFRDLDFSPRIEIGSDLRKNHSVCCTGNVQLASGLIRGGFYFPSPHARLALGAVPCSVRFRLYLRGDGNVYLHFLQEPATIRFGLFSVHVSRHDVLGVDVSVREYAHCD